MSDWMLAREMEIRSLLKQIEPAERLSQDLESSIKTINVAVGIQYGIHERDLAMNATRAKIDADGLKKWAENFVEVAKHAGRGMHTQRMGMNGPSHLPGLAASLNGRAKALSQRMTRIARKLDELH